MSARTRPAVLLWLALVVTVVMPLALNIDNLHRFALALGLSGWAALALPVTVDAAAAVALLVRLRALRDGDGAPGASVAVLAFGALSVALAAHEGHARGGLWGALALGALPLVALVSLDLVVGVLRREDMRTAGLLPARPPYYAPLRWVLAPVGTFRAWRHGILWEITDRTECLTAASPAVAGPAVPVEDTQAIAAPATDDTPGMPDPDTSVPYTGTKRDLIRDVVRAGYLDEAGVVHECATRGVDVSVREVRRIIAERPASAVVTLRGVR